MEWIRVWIMQVAGIIVLGAICDIIMPDGAMKKYVRLVMGLVLVFAVIKPIVNISADKIEIGEINRKRAAACELKNRLSEKERFNVIKIYKEKLCSNIRNEIQVPKDIHTEVKVEIEEDDDENFGNIKGITVIFYSDKEMSGEIERIKKTVGKKFGVDASDIRIVTLSGNQRT